jgi:hypothetical protein
LKALTERYKVSLSIYFVYQDQVTTNFIFGEVAAQEIYTTLFVGSLENGNCDTLLPIEERRG